MKGIQALIVAGGLGIVGAILNVGYLLPASQERDLDYFIAVKRDATVNRGTLLKAEDLEAVGIPKGRAGNLVDIAVRCEKHDVSGAEHKMVCRTLTGGSLLYNDDLRTTPPEEVDLGKDEGTMWISVTRPFVASLVMPGDKVSFLVPAALGSNVPTPARRSDAEHAAAGGGAEADTPMPVADADAALTGPPGPTEIIGPFTVLSLGNRLSSAEVFKASHLPPSQENVITIRVGLGDKRLEARAKRLWDRLYETNFQQVGIILHSRKDAR